VLSGPAGSST